MKIVLASLGKAHEAYVQAGVADFSKRIAKYFPVEWTVIAPPKNAASLSEKELKKIEAKQIELFLQEDDFLVLLDETGKNITSPDLSMLIQHQATHSRKRVVFLIGGAFGVDEKIKQRANFIWSLSKLVFPHMLVRLILAEQIYRACTILKNEKYHHV